MKVGGIRACVVVETTPNNFQAWLNHGQVLDALASTRAAEQLAERFGGDLSSADWRHFGRFAGFTNPKPERQLLSANAAIRAAAMSNQARLLESGRDTVGRLRYLEQPLTRGESHYEGGHA